MLQGFVKLIGGDPQKRALQALWPIIDQINALEEQISALSSDELRARAEAFRARIAAEVDGVEDEAERFAIEQEVLEQILPETFALVREAAKRTIGLRHYDVQLMGGIVLHRGEIAEMRTGEGKTLVATLPLVLNALAGRGAHLVTVNDYLARRDARWMAPIYRLLGLSVGVLQMAAATENGKKAFLVDPTRESPHEDQHHLRMIDRAEAYQADITYGTNAEFGFDYLRDNMTMRLEDRVQRRPVAHYYVIVDEVDNVLIDEARTPLIISGPASGDVEWYGRMAAIVKQLKPEDYEASEKDRSVALTEVGLAHVEALLGQPLSDPDRPEDVDPEQARLLGYLEQALHAQYLYRRNKDYLVQGGKVVIVDEFTGRLMPGRRWSNGLHQAVEAKEGVRVEPENVTYATVTLQNYYRMYRKLAGMTGTAVTEAEEFDKIYKLPVLPISTNLEYQAARPDTPLAEVKARDEEGYDYVYYTRPDDPEQAPLFYRRKDYPDLIYRTVEAKLRAIVTEIVRLHVLGRPQLVGTTSVESSERLSGRLRGEPVRRLMQVLLLRRAWMRANGREDDGRLIEELQPLYQPLEKLEPAFLRQFAKPLEMSINPEDPENLAALLEILDLPAARSDRLRSALQGGVPHQVLNARKHAEESQIIAGAGAFGAVTLATNMAGRGVDIKLGGELAEEVLAAVHRVLRQSGHVEPSEMTLEERRQAIRELPAAAYSLYAAEVDYFLKYFEDMEQVKALGGLHVIGSERHEARRIDNQLRGRAARQGDPGSSRFYLSMEDDLMRLFGGEQVNTLLMRLRVDDTLPLENRMVANLIEQSQHRVEGANFDVRKHLLEYDDVLNQQREQIYAQRDRIFLKDDLSEDVDEMVRREVEARVRAALEEAGEPWRLLAWLEGVQPSFAYDADSLYPSYTFRLLLDSLEGAQADPQSASSNSLRASLLDLASQAVEAENEHNFAAIAALIERSGDGLEEQIEERLDVLDTFLDAQRDNEQPRRAAEMREELSGLLRMQLQFNNEQMRQLAEDPGSLRDDLRAAIRAAITGLHAVRLIGAIEHRLGAQLPLDRNALARAGWDELADAVREAARSALDARLAQMAGENGQLGRDLNALLARTDAAGLDETGRLRLLLSLSQSATTAFDKKTHRQVRRVYTRFSYIFLAAARLEQYGTAQVTEDVLAHLEDAQEHLQTAWGEQNLARLTQTAAKAADLGPAALALQADRRDQPLSALTEDERALLVEQLGRRALTDIQRRLLLGAITELWVEYLTKVEALRISVGLEAYAQRDPLVQYKSQAAEMFRTLMADVRGLVVSRIFAYQPRAVAVTPVESGGPAPAASAPAAAPSGKSKKKKRKRH